MCRLCAYVGTPHDPETVVFGGTHSLHDQSYRPRELLHGSVNADGYGVVWYREGTPVRVAEVRPIWQDTNLRGLLQATSSSMILAAVRNATPGIPVDDSGNPPMVHGRWSFILNGFVEDFRPRHMRTLRSHLPDDLYGELKGSSDSETLFLLAVAGLRDGGSPLEALRRVDALVGDGVGSTSHATQLTMVLADGQRLAVLSTSHGETTNSLYVANGHPLAAGGTLLASERLDDHDSWAPVTKGEGFELAVPQQLT